MNPIARGPRGSATTLALVAAGLAFSTTAIADPATGGATMVELGLSATDKDASRDGTLVLRLPPGRQWRRHAATLDLTFGPEPLPPEIARLAIVIDGRVTVLAQREELRAGLDELVVAIPAGARRLSLRLETGADYPAACAGSVPSGSWRFLSGARLTLAPTRARRPVTTAQHARPISASRS